MRAMMNLKILLKVTTFDKDMNKSEHGERKTEAETTED